MKPLFPARRFTLVELLVVIVIIALVAGLLMTAVLRARARGREASCMSQVKQLGLAIELYVQEHDDHLPLCARLGPDPTYHLPSLAQLLAPYGAPAQLFHCPADGGADGLFAAVATSYEWNTFVSGRKVDRATLNLVGMKLETPILGDGEAFHPGGHRNFLWLDGHVSATLEVLIR
jgi:prepilin-type processing-associated H-X9-DG protein